MSKLLKELDGGLIGFTMLKPKGSSNMVPLFQVTSYNEKPTDLVYVSPSKLRNLLQEIADNSDDIGKVKLLAVKEGAEPLLNGPNKDGQAKVLARLFHILDDKGEKTGKVVWVSVQGPKGVTNLKKVPDDKLKRLKVIFDLGELDGTAYEEPLDWVETLLSRQAELKSRSNYVNFGDRAKDKVLNTADDDIMS